MTTLTSSVEATIDRLAPSRRPAGFPAGYHVWTELTFLHWRFPAEMVAKLLPRGVTLDTWDGDAWVGLVPFHMSGVRPFRRLPPLPGVSTFHETNVRTYVHVAGHGPGVWFFSLDAASWMAVKGARWGWHLPYFWSEMQIQRTETRRQYRSRRRGMKPAASSQMEIEIEGTEAPRPADPGTLEHFLVERYLLFAQSRRGGLFSGQVHHTPYPLSPARVISLDENLLAASGLPPTAPPCHALYCAGVQVEVFPLQPIVPRS